MTSTDLTRNINKFTSFAVHRAHRPDVGFTQISNSLIRSDIPGNQLKLLCYLLSHQDGYALSWTYVESKRALKIAQKTRQSALDGLIERGYVQWSADGKVLHVADEPIFLGEDVTPNIDVTATSVENTPVESTPHKNTKTTSKNTNSYSERRSGSKQVSNLRSDKSGSQPKLPNASDTETGELDDAAAWIEQRINDELTTAERSYMDVRMMRHGEDDADWAGELNRVWRAIAKERRERDAEARDVFSLASRTHSPE